MPEPDFFSPYTREEAAREAKLRAIEDFLAGRTGYAEANNGPQKDPPNPKLEIEVEVGERREPITDGQPHDAPGITVISHDEEDGIERHGSWTVMRTGGKKTSMEEYTRRKGGP